MNPTLLAGLGNSVPGNNASIMMRSTLLGVSPKTMGFLIVVVLALLVFFCIVGWKLFKKAGYKGYEALLSTHNFYVLITMAGKEGRYIFLFVAAYLWMTLSLLITVVVLSKILFMIGFLGMVYLYVDLTFSLNKKFKKPMRFGFGLLIIPFIFYPILALDGSKYKK